MRRIEVWRGDRRFTVWRESFRHGAGFASQVFAGLTVASLVWQETRDARAAWRADAIAEGEHFENNWLAFEGPGIIEAYERGFNTIREEVVLAASS